MIKTIMGGRLCRHFLRGFKSETKIEGEQDKDNEIQGSAFSSSSKICLLLTIGIDLDDYFEKKPIAILFINSGRSANTS